MGKGMQYIFVAATPPVLTKEVAQGRAAGDKSNLFVSPQPAEAKTDLCINSNEGSCEDFDITHPILVPWFRT
jgi:hypothetical protein